MIKLFQNGWFVGIITGIISGLLVFIITNFIINRKGNKEHLHQIKTANNEVISCLKPYIADKGLPEIKVFNAIIASIARKNSVQTTEMHTVDMFCEELIREVISDVYVSNDKKKEYTQSLANYMDLLNHKLTKDELTTLYDINYKKYRQKLTKKTSMLISIMASLLTTISAIIAMVLSSNEIKNSDGILNESMDFMFVIPTVLLTVFLVELTFSDSLESAIKLIKKTIERIKRK